MKMGDLYTAFNFFQISDGIRLLRFHISNWLEESSGQLPGLMILGAALDRSIRSLPQTCASHRDGDTPIGCLSSGYHELPYYLRERPTLVVFNLFQPWLASPASLRPQPVS